MRFFLAFVLTAALTGCADSHSWYPQQNGSARISAMSARSRLVRIGGAVGNIEDALAQAQEKGQDILVFPVILHWEDRATEWSMIPDKVEIKVDVIRIQTGEVISSGIIKGKSGLATFGGDHPQDLLPEPVADFVSSLF